MHKFLPRNQFQCLLDSLVSEGYALLGPRVRQDAIVYDSVTNVEQFPIGITDDQQPGFYQLNTPPIQKKSTSQQFQKPIQENNNQRFFSWAAAAQSLKPLCFSPTEVLWKSTVSPNGNLSFVETLPEDEAVEKTQSKIIPTAVIGVKACDLAALDLQDQHFLQQEYIDPYYEQRRKNLFLVSVDCSHPAETCFCHSTGDGPSAGKKADISLIELDDGFLIASGSDKGQKIVNTLPLVETTEAQINQKIAQHETAIEKQHRKLPAGDIPTFLKTRQAHAHWDDIGQRCLACGNCTAVCPSCFCHSEHDEAKLGSATSSHIRQWDSCFNQNHSYIHGIIIRPESKTRYRQWMTHKFSSWVEQYGRSGCTGCGRCISWCPVGIDIIAELDVLCLDEDKHGEGDE